MTKQARRFLSLLLAAVMVLGLCAAAMAEGAPSVSPALREPAVNQGEVQVLLNADEAGAVADGKYVLTYDSEVLSFEAAEAGTAWPQGSDVSLKVNSGVKDKLTAAFAGVYEAAKGDVVVLTFHVNKEEDTKLTLSGSGEPKELPVAVACPSAAFVDVKKTNWFHDCVDYAVVRDLMNGMDAAHFGPNAASTRAQVVTVLYRLAGSPDVSGLDNPFTDVKAGKWYTDAIVWAYHEGITEGVTAATFAPSTEVSRQYFVTFLYRYAKAYGCDVSARADLSVYTDCDKVSAFAKDAFSWAVAAGLVSGVTETTLSPRTYCVRAQIAKLLQGFELTVMG